MSVKGFLTLAQGKDFAEMAIDLALSVREHCSEQISVVCDEVALKRLSKIRGDLFEHVIPLARRIHPWGGKLVAATQSPYINTIFVDADVLFLKPVGWFNEVDERPVSMYGAYMLPTSRFTTYYESEKIFRDFQLKRYFWATSGIFRFRRPESDQFFQDCVNFYTEGIRRFKDYDVPGVADELVIGIRSDLFDIGSIDCETVHPWPMAEELATLKWNQVEQPVVHVFGRISRDFMQCLLSEVRRRRRETGVSGNSCQAWLRKSEGEVGVLSKVKRRLMSIITRVFRSQ